MKRIERSLVRYRHRRGDDADLRARLRELAAARRRFGYRRLHVLLAREDIIMNHKKLRRLYAEERLQVPRRGGRKRAVGTRAPLALPSEPNQRWSLDFLSDALGDGRRFRILAVVDDFTRECLALVADTSLPGLRVVRELEALVSRRGRPLGLVSDNGTELTSLAMLKADDDCLQELRWMYDRRDLAEVRRDLAQWLARWHAKYPKLTAWAEDNIEETLTFYRLPRAHHKHLKSTNMLERLNQEIKRRTQVVRIFPNGESCLRLVRALAVEMHENWLEAIRYLNMEHLKEHKKEALRAAA